MSSVRDSLRQIDNNSWLLSESLLLCRKDSRFFVLSQASTPLTETHPLSDIGEIQKVYNARDKSYLRGRQPLGFSIPNIYFHTNLRNRYLIITSALPGRTLYDSWHEMEETVRQECISRIAKICMELASWEGDSISGVDGKQLADRYFIKSREMNFDPDNLLKNCKEVGMNCSSFHFYHCDLGSGNILYDEEDGSIGIIDWETAGYVPKEWIRTKFRCSSGLDLPERAGSDIPSTDWRRRVSQELEKLGFSDVVHDWEAWWFAK
ncbi:hypothetical protein F4808DRAFT_468463 [Astrocystis sublimbata]|nr:hypothetical protein F4808DRAFT_468463 [Astrocystis sublimbata]